MSVGHSWLPRACCGPECVRAGAVPGGRKVWVAVRVGVRTALVLTLLPALPVLAIRMPGRTRLQRGYCRLVMRCLGVRITVSGGPIRNLPGVLVVSGHVSWLDIFTIGAVLPGSFVAKSELTDWRALGVLARVMKVIPIDREDLRIVCRVLTGTPFRGRIPATVDI